MGSTALSNVMKFILSQTSRILQILMVAVPFSCQELSINCLPTSFGYLAVLGPIKYLVFAKNYGIAIISIIHIYFTGMN